MIKKVVMFLFMLGVIGCNDAENYDKVLKDYSDNIPVSLGETFKTNTKKVKVMNLDAKQVIRLEGVVGENIDPLIDKLNKMNEENVNSIYILIDSPGGSVLQGAKFISAMEASKVPVYTVCMNMCASMAAIIHQYGTKRYMMDRSLLMFHDASGSLSGTLPQMQSRLTFITRLTDKMDAYIAKRAGVDIFKFLSDLGAEIWMDADDSTNRHFNDALVYVRVKGEVRIPIIGLDQLNRKFTLDSI